TAFRSTRNGALSCADSEPFLLDSAARSRARAYRRGGSHDDKPVGEVRSLNSAGGQSRCYAARFAGGAFVVAGSAIVGASAGTGVGFLPVGTHFSRSLRNGRSTACDRRMPLTIEPITNIHGF